MTKFFDLLERSIIVQSFLTLMFGGAVVTLAMLGREIPDILVQMTTVIVSFWMGTKVQHTVDQNREAKGRGATPGRRQE
ncbi:hypothetical protein ES707_09611 [subsurface metagenome]